MSLSIVRREIGAAPLSTDLHPVLDRIFRGRNIRSVEELETGARSLAHYQQLKGIERAAELLVDAIFSKKHVTIVGDFDADGATSTAICMLSLQAMGLQNIDFLVPTRFDFGYGLSPQIVDVAHQQGAELIITVDNGIACIEGVAHAKSLGMTVIVTDHHLPASQLPAADAIVNPNQPGCDFPSKSLAGVGVAFYLMLAVRAQLQAQGGFEQLGLNPPNLANLLDIVAVGTVADVVTLDQNNRILVHQGLQRIRAGKCRPGIQALVEVAGRELEQLTATDLGFVIGPRLNAAGRLDDISLGIGCLLCDDPLQARAMATELDQLNRQRRNIEADMKAQAQSLIDALMIEQDGEVPAAFVVYKEDFHQGVVGILAGRLKDQYARPTIVFAQQDDASVKGSARSIAGIHIRDVLEEVNVANPGLISKFGGHAMAAGLSLDTHKLDTFKTAFTAIVERHLNALGTPDIVLTDGELEGRDMSLPVAKVIRQAGPFGQGFDAPLFDGVFKIVNQRLVGENHLKLVLLPEQGSEIDAIAFNVDTRVWPNAAIKYIQAVYRLDVNVFRGRETVQCVIDKLAPYENG